jgi:tryptophanyl-tRNA synthetase
LKKELTELLTSRLSAIQTRYNELLRSGGLEQILRDGAAKAEAIAGETLREVRALTGVG